jgi:hypothetical protein
MSPRVRLLALAAALVPVLGCHTTTIRSGRLPDARPAVYLDGMEAATFANRWHHGFVNGLVEVGGNYNLERICPRGWADVTTERDFFTGLVSMVTYGVYAPQTVTIRCAASPLPELPQAPHAY